MPLTKRQFELGVDEEGETMMRQVYELLAAHSELAYSLQEIQGAILGQNSFDTSGKVQRAVKALVGIGAVDQREVGERDYFAFLQVFDTGTWMSAKHSFALPPPFPPPRSDS
jgi:hypothetical protein